MKQFSYTIQGENGLHARDAGMLVEQARGYMSNINIEYNDKSENLKRLFSVAGLGVRKGDMVTVTADGGDESAAAKQLEEFFRENL